MNDKQLLIVDDSPLIISRIKGLLDGLKGICISGEAHSVAEAMILLSASPLPNIVLLDINLPDVNGLQLLRHLRENHPAIKVIMISNQGGIFYRELCLRIGAAHYIDKSSEFELIPTLLSNLLLDSQ